MSGSGKGPGTLTVSLPNGLIATLDPTQTFTVTRPEFSVSPPQTSPGQNVTLMPAQGSALSDIQNVRFAGSTANPTVASFSPSSGGKGTSVLTSGLALASGPYPFFGISITGGGVPATSFSHDAGTGKITAVVPALPSGSCYMQCQDATGQGVVSTSTFTVP
ncbi:MAG: hypothetical protein EB084_24355 [Proteobacteria bacterium]|nr:hypothetical protein [Pseudomonadota bacterium]